MAKKFVDFCDDDARDEYILTAAHADHIFCPLQAS